MTVSQTDEKWTEGVFKQAFSNKPFEQVGFNQNTSSQATYLLSLIGLGQVAKIFADVPPNPAKHTFAG
jgi:hypothetical protein